MSPDSKLTVYFFDGQERKDTDALSRVAGRRVAKIIFTVSQHHNLHAVKLVLLDKAFMLSELPSTRETSMENVIAWAMKPGVHTVETPFANIESIVPPETIDGDTGFLVVMTRDAYEAIQMLKDAPSVSERSLPLLPLALGRMMTVLSSRNSSPPSDNTRSAPAVHRGHTTHRPVNTLGPAVGLFVPQLARLSHDLSHLPEQFEKIQQDPVFVGQVDEFINQISASDVNERQCVEALKSFLDACFGPGEWASAASRPIMAGSWRNHIIAEFKELGSPGDPRLQGILDYEQRLSSEENRSATFHFCFPVIILGISGPQISVSSAIMLDGAVRVDYLGIFDLMYGKDPNATLHTIAALFGALIRAAKELKKLHFAARKEPGDPLSALFPHPISPDGSALPELKFLGKLGRDGSLIRPGSQFSQHPAYANYVAELDDKLWAVKFTRTYSQIAHQTLADKGFAPILQGVYMVQEGYMMVVMQLVHGSTLWHWQQIGKDFTLEMRHQLEEAVNLLHSRNLVHGDLRNIMIEAASDSMQVKIVDFDWGGVEGEAVYPARISRRDMNHRWHQEVGPCRLVKKEHDKHLLNLILKSWDESELSDW
ncbi:hypothetical protein FB45DRAFT_106993 [Roridomyces roridus]|uniref:Protein kinase domain-containing protein n=1 Tax=Roridomyces roridus TaxID=1738132 RepID=A0AAD7BK23_9AGAR|nr:hypothetical protein FB45DRAFT_106993 [Roridomyces roridus]